MIKQLYFAWILSLYLFSAVASFQFQHVVSATRSCGHCIRLPESRLAAIIQADDVDFEFDIGQGGVQLAHDTAIQISGSVQHAPGTAKTQLAYLQRYNQLRKVTKEAVVQNVLQQVYARIIATGRGRELYRDPGETTVSEIIHSPKDAVRDALLGFSSATDSVLVHINFLGGDDLQVLEVLDAVEQMVLMLDVKTKCKINFHSISDGQFPDKAATVTVLGFSEMINEGSAVIAEMTGVERAIALGQVYFHDGVYYIAVDEDINPAMA